MAKNAIIRTAVMSDCRAYRYRLSRIWDESLPRLGWVMLNPSTADAEKDDPTIRRCMNYAKLHGYGSIIVVNLYAFRATKPADIVHKPGIDEVNEAHWLPVDRCCQNVVAAWGALGRQTVEAHRAVRNFSQLMCLGTTKSGQPRHPLYIPDATLLSIYSTSGVLEAVRNA